MKGEIDEVSGYKIAGWIIPDPEETTPLLSLSVAGIQLREHRAEYDAPGRPEARRFVFNLGENLRTRLPVDAPIVVVPSGHDTPLPVAKDVSDVYPGRAEDDGSGLRDMLAGKWSIDHWGILHVTFGTDPSLIGKSARIYDKGRSLVHDALGAELYLTGGNLLGIVREGKFLDHDDDIDASYIIDAETPNAAAERFFDQVRTMAPIARDRGLKLKIVHPLHLYVIAKGLPYLDVLVGWLTREGYWCRPSGYGGMLDVNEFQFRDIDYAGTKMAIPTHAERELELTYGPGWNSKDDHYSKVRPQAPLKQIQAMQWTHRDRVTRENAFLTDFFAEGS